MADHGRPAAPATGPSAPQTPANRGRGQGRRAPPAAENIYPAEVERALADLPGLIDVAVVGAADEQWGETVVAVTCLADGANLTLDEVREHCATKLARYKLPRRLKLVKALPRNASGKLDKIAIRRVVT